MVPSQYLINQQTQTLSFHNTRRHKLKSKSPPIATGRSPSPLRTTLFPATINFVLDPPFNDDELHKRARQDPVLNERFPPLRHFDYDSSYSLGIHSFYEQNLSRLGQTHHSTPSSGVDQKVFSAWQWFPLIHNCDYYPNSIYTTLNHLVLASRQRITSFLRGVYEHLTRKIKEQDDQDNTASDSSPLSPLIPCVFPSAFSVDDTPKNATESIKILLDNNTLPLLNHSSSVLSLLVDTPSAGSSFPPLPVYDNPFHLTPMATRLCDLTKKLINLWCLTFEKQKARLPLLHSTSFI